MDLQLTDKHALITGGSKGIGLACAKGFLAEGARVTLVSRDRATLEAARTGLLGQFPAARVHIESADLKDAAAALAAVDDAEKALGPKFDIRAFHDTVLGNGGVTLAVLEQQVDAWIARVQAGG